MNSRPKVSVIIPTYKRSEMLCRAIDSVLNQTYPNIEIIVVDDNNPDTEWRSLTSNRMSSYVYNEKIRYICHQSNRNGSAARNTGLKEATGDIITFLDDDDVYLHNKVEIQVNYLLSHPEYRAVYCGWIVKGNHIIPMGEGDLSYGTLSGTDLIITNSIMMWREDAISCGGWDESLTRHQEAAFLLNYFKNGGLIGRVDEFLIDFDTSDRINAIDPKKNENIVNYLLHKYHDLIDKCESDKAGSKNLIYANRYKAIIFNYLLNHYYYKALIVYFRSPFIINKLLIKDILSRIKKH